MSAVIIIQSWTRMILDRWKYRRIRSKIIDVKSRGLVQPEKRQKIVDDVNKNEVLSRLLAHRKMKQLEEDRNIQKSALSLQSVARRRFYQQAMIAKIVAIDFLTTKIQRRKPRIAFCRETAMRNIRSVLIRRRARYLWISIWMSWKLAQACVRRRIFAALERNRRTRVRETFHRAVRTQRMWLIRAIFQRRDVIVVLQAMARRTLATRAYIEMVTNAREAARVRRERGDAADVLTNHVRMRSFHGDLHVYVGKINLLRRAVRSRCDQSQYQKVSLSRVIERSYPQREVHSFLAV